MTAPAEGAAPPRALRVVIADDEPVARRGLRAMLGAMPAVEVVGEAASGEEAVAVVLALRPDVLFLDVRMPALDGFAVLAALPRGAAPAVVFTTAFEQYALPAFDASAIDYLLKPFDAARLARALRRVRAFGSEAAGAAGITAPRDEDGRRLTARGRDVIIFLEPDEVDWIESWGNYVRLHARGRRYLMRETTGAVEARLDATLFLRISRSVIVNAARVRRLVPRRNGQTDVVLEGGATLRASRRHRAALQRFFGLR